MSPDLETLQARAPGRPRSDDADRAIRDAALDLLVEVGYGRLSLEGVAARAGVGKATIYRRWESKQDLVLDAVIQQCGENVVEPDTGSLRGDLLEMYRALVRKFRRDGDVMHAFVAEHHRHPELGKAFRETFLDDRRAAMRTILERGIARGELSETDDLELLVDVGSALFWHRLSISGAPIDDSLPQRLIDQFFKNANTAG